MPERVRYEREATPELCGMRRSSSQPIIHHHRHNIKNRFELIKTLGQGTYGKVKLAVEYISRQKVAIKYIRKNRIQDEYDLNRIRREIKIMASLNHPHIINVIEVFENKEKIVLVMEYASGGELYEYINMRKKLDEKEARKIFRQIVSAVRYCHQNGIVHRDLKLENIVLTEDGNVKIADFGLSNYFTFNSLLSTYCGSPLYASPEIVNGTPYTGPEVDCWSLGVVLYTLVYGAMPFDGSEFSVLKKQITTGTIYEPRTQSPAGSLIRALLEPNPAMRASMDNIVNHWWVNEGYTTTPCGMSCNVITARSNPPPYCHKLDLSKRHSWSDSPYRKILTAFEKWDTMDSAVNPTRKQCHRPDTVTDTGINHERQVSEPVSQKDRAPSDSPADETMAAHQPSIHIPFDLEQIPNKCRPTTVGRDNINLTPVAENRRIENHPVIHERRTSVASISTNIYDALDMPRNVDCKKNEKISANHERQASAGSESGSMNSSDDDKNVFDASRKPTRGILKKTNTSMDSDSGCASEDVLSQSSGLPSPTAKHSVCDLTYDLQDIENALTDAIGLSQTDQSVSLNNISQYDRNSVSDGLYENLHDACYSDNSRKLASCIVESTDARKEFYTQSHNSTNDSAFTKSCDNSDVPKRATMPLKGILKRPPSSQPESANNQRYSLTSNGSTSSRDTLDQSFESVDNLQFTSCIELSLGVSSKDYISTGEINKDRNLFNDKGTKIIPADVRAKSIPLNITTVQTDGNISSKSNSIGNNPAAARLVSTTKNIDSIPATKKSARKSILTHLSTKLFYVRRRQYDATRHHRLSSSDNDLVQKYAMKTDDVPLHF